MRCARLRLAQLSLVPPQRRPAPRPRRRGMAAAVSAMSPTEVRNVRYCALCRLLLCCAVRFAGC
jgi:hypothetical protein